MALDLPAPVANYFATEDNNDLDGLSRCYTAEAVVRDEGRTIVGPAAIKAWMVEAKRKYQHTTVPLHAAPAGDGALVVSVQVSGNFPNSPVTLKHAFHVSDRKISSLEIR